MIKRMLTSALFAGVAAGLFAAVLHFVFLERDILLAETFEDGTAVRFAGVAKQAEDHHNGAMAGMAADHDEDTIVGTAGAPEHAHAGEGPERSAFARNALTVLFMALVYSGYGMLLVAGFALAAEFGKVVTAREGLLWGLAGFAAFHLMPAMGLSPELPGIAAADLTARQIWWAGTALSTAAALALIGYGRGVAAYGLAALLLAVPHLIGAPDVEGFSDSVPPELAAAFAARALGVGLIAWALLGVLAGRFWHGSAA